MDIQPTTVEIKAQLEWRFFRDDRSRRWIAICDPLKLTIEADTHTELRENIADGLNLFFGSMLKDDLLDEYLVQHGWSYGDTKPAHQEGGVQFDVPFELIAAQRNNDPARCVH